MRLIVLACLFVCSRAGISLLNGNGTFSSTCVGFGGAKNGINARNVTLITALDRDAPCPKIDNAREIHELPSIYYIVDPSNGYASKCDIPQDSLLRFLSHDGLEKHMHPGWYPFPGGVECSAPHSLGEELLAAALNATDVHLAVTPNPFLVSLSSWFFSTYFRFMGLLYFYTAFLSLFYTFRQEKSQARTTYKMISLITIFRHVLIGTLLAIDGWFGGIVLTGRGPAIVLPLFSGTSHFSTIVSASFFGDKKNEIDRIKSYDKTFLQRRVFLIGGAAILCFAFDVYLSWACLSMPRSLSTLVAAPLFAAEISACVGFVRLNVAFMQTTTQKVGATLRRISGGVPIMSKRVFIKVEIIAKNVFLSTLCMMLVALVYLLWTISGWLISGIYSPRAWSALWSFAVLFRWAAEYFQVQMIGKSSVALGIVAPAPHQILGNALSRAASLTPSKANITGEADSGKFKSAQLGAIGLRKKTATSIPAIGENEAYDPIQISPKQGRIASSSSSSLPERSQSIIQLIDDKRTEKTHRYSNA